MSYYCRHIPEEIMEIDGVTYWASDADSICYFRGDLVLNLTSGSNITGAMREPNLKDHFDVTFEELMIPWRDGSVPQVKMTFWKALHAHILKKGYKDVAVHCFAGHGRTGTMLASLMVAVGGWNAQESVKFIRENYCDSAVETEIQCLHLQEVDYMYNDREPSEDNEVIASNSYRKSTSKYGSWSGHWMD
jgi:hypothetical protein